MLYSYIDLRACQFIYVNLCSKVLEVLVQAAEFVEIPVRHRDEVPLQKLFLIVRSELNLDPKNMKSEQQKFLKKRHPAFIKVSN